MIVNFEQGGAFIPPEMTKSGRACVVIDVDDLGQTVSLDRVNFPHTRDHRGRRYVRAVVTAQDLKSIISGVLYVMNVR